MEGEKWTEGGEGVREVDRGRWTEGVREGERKVDHGKEGGRWTERGRGKEGGYSSLLLRMSTKFV